MAALTYAEKTRLGSILRRIMLDDADPAEVQMTKNTEDSSLANQAQAPLGGVPSPAPLTHFRRLLD